MFSSYEIRLLRMSRQMKQEAIAQKMCITKQRYSELENHQNLRAERVAEILKALGYTFETAKKYLESIPSPHVISGDGK
jgi:transcriptional regulator with XRE-family HTH domain